MHCWLLLVDGVSGIARGVTGIEVADGPEELEASRLEVGRVTVNGERGGVLALSARRGAEVALQLLFREMSRRRTIGHLAVTTAPLEAAVTGHSGELLFGLAVFTHLARRDGLSAIVEPRFAATGTLDPLGNVGSVEAVVAKLEAALASYPAAGGLVFYPRADEGQIDGALRRRCRECGLQLHPVDRIDDALAALGIEIKGGWTGTPFRSLNSFNFQDSRIFFGRQGEVAALRERLHQRAAAGRPGMLVIGASGAGKSSFCMAGLLPALKLDVPDLEHAVWRPREAISGQAGTEVGEADLARSVLASWRRRDENQTGFDLAAAAPDNDDLTSLATVFPESVSQMDRHVWVVDQFEELFTLGFTAAARIAFARFLRDLQTRGVWVVGTLRSEFYGQYLDLRDEHGNALLTPLLDSDGVFNLPRMGRDALRQVIVGPAELAGLHFGTRVGDGIRLDDVLLADAMGTDDALPLLGFALQTLYDGLERAGPDADPSAEQPRLLTFAAYKGLGGLRGAIGRIVEPMFGSLDAEARATLPGVLSALAVPSGDGQRETARPAAIDQWPAGSPGRRLIDALVAIRVLVSEQAVAPDAPAQLRVAHEALFTHWDEARRLLQESQQIRLQVEDFRQRAVRWELEGRPEGALLTSPKDLEVARGVQNAVPNTQRYEALNAFVYQSIALEDGAIKTRRNRTRFSIAVAIGSIVVLSTLTVFAFSERQHAIAKETETAGALQDKVHALTATREARDETERQKIAALAARDAESDARSIAETQANLATRASLAEREQRRLADLRTEEALRARQLAQTALDKAVARLTNDTYRDDSRLEGIQQAMLEDLLPIYLQLVDEAKSDPRSDAGYASAVDELATLVASTTSLQRAKSAYPQILERLHSDQLAEGATAEATSRIGLNYASVLFSNGEEARATEVLETLNPNVRASVPSQCLRFRIDSAQNEERDDSGSRDALLESTLEWKPTAFAERKARAACLITIGGVYSNNNEFAPADSSFQAATEALDSLIREKPFSVDAYVLAGLLHIGLSRHLYVQPKSRTPDGTSKANIELKSAEALIDHAITLSPNNRAALEAKLRVQFLIYRTLARYPVGDEPRDISTDIGNWMAAAEQLIERDPDSPALEHAILDYGRTAIEPRSKASSASKQVSEQIVNECTSTVDNAIAMANRMDNALVAQKLVVTISSCLLRRDPGDPLPSPGTLPTIYVDRRRAIDTAWTRALDLAPDEWTRFLILASRIGSLNAASGDVDSARALMALADSEARRRPESLRFTAIGWVIRTVIANQLVAKDPSAAKAVLNECVSNSAKQALMCDALQQMVGRGVFGNEIASFGKQSPVFRTIGIAGPTGSEAGGRFYELVFNPGYPVEVATYDRGKVSIIDDTQLSSEIAPADDNLYRGSADAAMAAIGRAVTAGRDFKEAYITYRIGPGSIALMEIPEEEKARLNTFYTVTFEWHDPQKKSGPSTWKTSAFSKNTTPVVLDEALLKEKVVILLQGKNVYGTPIFTYLELTLAKLQELRDKMRANADFMPGDYGDVLEAGMGLPSRETRAKMIADHNMIDVPRPQRSSAQ